MLTEQILYLEFFHFCNSVKLSFDNSLPRAFLPRQALQFHARRPHSRVMCAVRGAIVINLVCGFSRIFKLQSLLLCRGHLSWAAVVHRPRSLYRKGFILKVKKKRHFISLISKRSYLWALNWLSGEGRGYHTILNDVLLSMHNFRDLKADKSRSIDAHKSPIINLTFFVNKRRVYSPFR